MIFNDVAVCFSLKDWQLLAHWQRKLYQNIMKEIHGALTALGKMCMGVLRVSGCYDVLAEGW